MEYSTKASNQFEGMLIIETKKVDFKLPKGVYLLDQIKQSYKCEGCDGIEGRN